MSPQIAWCAEPITGNLGVLYEAGKRLRVLAASVRVRRIWSTRVHSVSPMFRTGINTGQSRQRRHKAGRPAGHFRKYFFDRSRLSRFAGVFRRSPPAAYRVNAELEYMGQKTTIGRVLPISSIRFALAMWVVLSHLEPPILQNHIQRSGGSYCFLCDFGFCIHSSPQEEHADGCRTRSQKTITAARRECVSCRMGGPSERGRPTMATQTVYWISADAAMVVFGPCTLVPHYAVAAGANAGRRQQILISASDRRNTSEMAGGRPACAFVGENWTSVDASSGTLEKLNEPALPAKSSAHPHAVATRHGRPLAGFINHQPQVSP